MSRWGGQGIWDSGAGVLDVSVKSASRAVSPIAVDCQCPPKVNQVHNRQSLTPRSDGCFLCSARFCSHLTVGVKMAAFAVCSSVFPSPGNLELCLFVRVTDRQTDEVADGETEIHGAFWAVRRALVNGELLPVVFAQKEPFCFPAEQSRFSQKAWTTLLLLPWRMFTHKYAQINPYRPSLHLPPWFGTKVGYGTKLREISLFCLLTVGWCGSRKLYRFTFNHFQHWTHSVSWPDPCQPWTKHLV